MICFCTNTVSLLKHPFLYTLTAIGDLLPSNIIDEVVAFVFQRTESNAPSAVIVFVDLLHTTTSAPKFIEGPAFMVIVFVNVSLPHLFVDINFTRYVPLFGKVTVAVLPFIGAPLLIIHWNAVGLPPLDVFVNVIGIFSQRLAGEVV